MLASRRDLLRASLASLAYLAPVGCRPSGALREDGRLVVSFWYAYGDLVRKVLLELVARFNASQSRIVVKAVHQGDYFEALAKLRTAIAAGAAPAALARRARGLAVPGARRRPRAPRRLRGRALARACPRARPERVVRCGQRRGRRGEPLVRDPLQPLDAHRVRQRPLARARARRAARARGTSSPRRRRGSRAAATAATRGGDSRSPSPGGTGSRWWARPAGAWSSPTGASRSEGGPGEDALRFWQRLVHVDRVMRPPPGRDYQAWQSTNESFLRERVAMMWSSTAYVRYLEGQRALPGGRGASAAPRAGERADGRDDVRADARRARGGEARRLGVRPLDVRRTSRRSPGRRAPGTCPSPARRSSA